MVDPTTALGEYGSKGPLALVGVFAGFVLGFALFWGWENLAASGTCADGWHNQVPGFAGGEFHASWAVVCDRTDEIAATYDPWIPLAVLGFAGLLGGAVGHSESKARELKRYLALHPEQSTVADERPKPRR